MSKTISLILDDKAITTQPGATILQAAQENGLDIPHICYHEALTPPAVCRVCVVEVEKARVLQAACVTPCTEGMVVHTRSERVEDSRRTILELLDSAVDLSEAPDIFPLLEEYGANRARFEGGRRREHAVLDDNPFFLRDYDQCVMCWRCVEVCAGDGQFAFAINFGGRGFESHIATFVDHPLPETTCVFCGQCVGVCPTGALKPKAQWGLEQGFSLEDIWQMGRKKKRGS